MGYIVRLLHGSDALNLQAGRYCISEDTFAPPTASRAVTFGKAVVGSAATVKERVNRSWSFGVTIKAGTTSGEAERALRELQSFLNRAGGPTPLYVAYRAYDDYDYEPFFGLAGAFARYEVVHGSAQATGPYNPQVATGYILNVAVSLTIKPQAVFPAMPAGQATGSLYEDYIGKEDGRSRGTILGRATTNRYTNPVFMHATYDTGWAAVGLGFTASANKDRRYILFGDTSVRFSVMGAATYLQSVTLAASTQYFSVYVRMIDDSAPTGTSIFYDSTGLATTASAVGNGWYILTATATGTGGAADAGISSTSTTVLFVDGFQVNTGQFSALTYGDLLDCAWSGTKHASLSTATAARLRYAFADFLGVRTGYTIRLVWSPPPGSAGTRYFFEDSNDDIALYLDSSHRVNFHTATANSIQSAATTVTANAPYILHITYTGATATVYKDGVSIATGAIAPDASDPTYIYVGTDNAAANHCGGTIMGLATFRRSMTAAEVWADYGQVRRQADDGDRIDPLPWLWTQDGDNVVDNDNYPAGGLYSHFVLGGLMGDDIDAAYKLDSSQTFVLGAGVTFGALPVQQRLFDKDILDDGGTTTLLFVNGAGTADTDANGDNVLRTSLSTSTSNVMATAITPLGAQLLAEARGVVGYFVAKDAATNSNVQVRLQITFGANQETFYSSPWRTLATSDAFRPYVTAELPLDVEDVILDSQRKLGFRLQIRRTGGASTQNFDISHAIWMPNYTAVYTADMGNSAGVDMAYVRGRVFEGVDDASPALTIGRRLFTRPLLVRADRLNVYFLQHTHDCYSAAISTWTTGYNLEIEQFVVTPRFDIL